MEEFLENLLYSATFPAMDRWRHFSAAEPPLGLMRVFVSMELRLQQRYGHTELERLVSARRAPQLVKKCPTVPALLFGIALCASVMRGASDLTSTKNLN